MAIDLRLASCFQLLNCFKISGLSKATELLKRKKKFFVSGKYQIFPLLRPEYQNALKTKIKLPDFHHYFHAIKPATYITSQLEVQVDSKLCPLLMLFTTYH